MNQTVRDEIIASLDQTDVEHAKRLKDALGAGRLNPFLYFRDGCGCYYGLYVCTRADSFLLDEEEIIARAMSLSDASSGDLEHALADGTQNAATVSRVIQEWIGRQK